MFERVHAMLIKEFIQVFRNPRMRSTIFIAPLFQLFIFGYAATTDIRHIPTAVYDLDNSPQSRELIRKFIFSKYFDLKYRISDDKQQQDLLDRAKVNVVLRFNHGFAADLQAGNPARMQIIVDGTDSNTASVVLNYANKILLPYNQKLLVERALALSGAIRPIPGVEVKERAWFNENLVSRNFYLPGVIALLVTLITLMLTSMSIVREKELGTIEQLIVSPIKPYELILGKMLPFAVIGIIDVIFITAVGVLWFKVPIRGDLLLLFGATLVYLLNSLGLGLFISTICSTMQEASLTMFLMFFPINMLSGFIFPIQNMPKLVQYLTYINPLRYYLVILRGIFLKGVGIETLWPQILILFVLGVCILSMSMLRFHKRLS